MVHSTLAYNCFCFQLIVLVILAILTSSFVGAHPGRNRRETLLHSLVNPGFSSTPSTQSNSYSLGQVCTERSNEFLNEQTRNNQPECTRAANNTNLATLSLCPWVSVMDVDPDRIPREIPVAKCCFQQCSGDLANSISVCQPVYKNMSVLKKNNTSESNDSRDYVQIWLSVPIACSCSIPNVLRSAK